jgi:hypothetical protein
MAPRPNGGFVLSEWFLESFRSRSLRLRLYTLSFLKYISMLYQWLVLTQGKISFEASDEILRLEMTEIVHCFIEISLKSQWFHLFMIFSGVYEDKIVEITHWYFKHHQILGHLLRYRETVDDIWYFSSHNLVRIQWDLTWDFALGKPSHW